uniref:Retrotransposon Copia-like N-terminal domain-containing protein n=1 Tax=Fagus sylvatica TaxID=28930 RepID=A0A2N9IYC4_FAGSY
MAESSSSANLFQIPNISPFISIKLDGTNYLQWISQFLPILRSYDLLSIVDGSGSEVYLAKHLVTAEGKQDANPAYVLWNKKDQLVLSWLIATLTPNVFSTVYGLNMSAKSGIRWQPGMLHNQSLWPHQTPTPLPYTPTSNTIGIANQSSMDHKNPIIHLSRTSHIKTRNQPPPFQNTNQIKSSPIPFNSSRPPCQICGKPNHQALDCYHRMDYSYQGRHPPTQLVAMVAHTNSQLVEEDHQPWYADSGANQHIIADLENLNLSSEPYQGNTDVAVGNGSSL